MQNLMTSNERQEQFKLANYKNFTMVRWAWPSWVLPKVKKCLQPKIVYSYLWEGLCKVSWVSENLQVPNQKCP